MSDMPNVPNDVPNDARNSVRTFLRGRSELGVCALLLAVGALVLTDALTMETVASVRGPVGPRTVPLIVGGALLVVAVLLAVDVLRGASEGPRETRPAEAVSGRRAGEGEGGEDAGPAEPGDWRTVALLTGVFLAFTVLIDPLGFPLSGALLFWGSAYALGSRQHALTRDPLIAAGLSLVTYVVFDTLLGVPLPGGPLMEAI